jgi:branched-subunit amino acid transport protein
MSDAWAIVLAIGAGTVAIKASGPVLLGGRDLPPQVARVVALLAPALLAALVVTAGLATGERIDPDARLVGLAAAAAALVLRAPVLLVVVVAAAAAAVARLAGLP